jgi:hypothetical protein
MKLREHEIILQSKIVMLQTMTEGDWDILLKWNGDPDVLFFNEGMQLIQELFTLRSAQGEIVQQKLQEIKNHLSERCNHYLI